MRVHEYTLVLFQIIAVLITLALMGLAIWWLIGRESDVNIIEMRGHMIRMEASAKTYYARLRFYDGVCSDIGVPANYVCHESTDAFAIETKLSAGRFLCLDSTGFLGETTESKKEAVSCNKVQ